MKKLNINQKIAVTAVALATSYLLVNVAKYWLADYFYANGNVEYAVTFSPQEPLYRIETAKLYAKLGDAVHAEGEIEIVKHSASRNVKLLKEVANIYGDLGEVDKNYLLKEHEELKKILKFAPTDVQIWYQLALSYGKLGQMEESRETLLKVLEMKPDYELANKYLEALDKFK